jgi:predicted metal-binding membrane protein
VPFIALVGVLIGLAWLALGIWGLSPYRRFLAHDHVEVAVVPLAFGWTLMIVAMMLPSSIPLLQTFETVTSTRADRRRLAGLLVAGYLSVWMGFGVFAHVGDLLLHRAVDGAGWLQGHEWVIGAAVIMLAGLYQLLPLKERCLSKCRSPFSLVAEHWRGQREHRQSFLLGVHHGVFCVGCCWPLMLLMFVVGVGNLGWMLVLTAVMVAEKTLSWGALMSRPLGLVLVAWGSVLGVVGVLGLR